MFFVRSFRLELEPKKRLSTKRAEEGINMHTTQTPRFPSVSHSAQYGMDSPFFCTFVDHSLDLSAVSLETKDYGQGTRLQASVYAPPDKLHRFHTCSNAEHTLLHTLSSELPPPPHAPCVHSKLSMSWYWMPWSTHHLSPF